MQRFALAAGCSLLAVGCYPAKQVTLTSADLAVPARTRMTGRLQSAAGQEEVPAGLSRELVLDEATIVKHDDAQTCIAVVMRTSADLDAPLSEWLVDINGVESRFLDETSTVSEVPYTGQRTIIAAERATQRGYASFNWTQPVSAVFRVFERRGTACGPAVAKNGKIDALFRNRVVRGQEWFERFTWNVR